ncbi:MAG: UvrD-helicase domain-containing protein, partial [Acidobacteriota bacterium]
MRILLAGPGTGKTTNIKRIIDEEFSNATRILVLSFTNFTVNDLRDKFADREKYSNVECLTLHKLAMKLNHLTNYHILADEEETILRYMATKYEMEVRDLFDLLKCITFSEMIASCLAFIKANPDYVKDKFEAADLLLVDEFQDFDPNEQELVHELVKLCGETIIL